MSKIYPSWGVIWGVTLLTFLPGGPLAAAEDPPLLAVRKPGQQDFKGGEVYGIVTRLDKNGFSVRGRVDERVAPQRWGELDLQLSADLRAGRFNPGMPSGRSYLPEDLQVGDGVSVDFNRRGGADICTAISIVKRPDGRVPLSPNVKADERQEKAVGYKYHDWQNAQNDLWERGIPLPDKFKPKPLKRLPSSSDLNKTQPTSPPVKPIPPAKP